MEEFLNGDYDMTSTEQLKADALNNESGNLTGMDCPVCKNKGFVASVENGHFCTHECECMNRRRAMKRLEQSGLKPILEMYTINNYETEKSWQSDAKKAALEFVKNPDGWFFISGTPGTGKTHLCTAICGMLLEQNKNVRYMVWRDEAPMLKANVNDSSIYQKAMGELKEADVLYIDDFWKGGVTEADINLAFELLNARYNDRSKITIISGEKDMETLLDIDEAVGSRIWERSKGHRIKTPPENYRLREA